MINDVQVALEDASRGRVKVQKWALQPALIQFSFDLAAVILALTLACLAGRWIVDELGWPLALPDDLAAEARALAVVLLAVPAGKAASGLYPGYGVTLVERLRRQTLVLLWVGVGVLLVDAHVHDGRWGIGFALTCIAVLAPLTVLSDILARKVLMRLRLWGRPCVILGAGAIGSDVARRLIKHDYLGFMPVLFVDDDPATWGTVVEGVPVVGPASFATSGAAANRVSTAILALSGNPRERLREVVRALPFRTVLLVADLPGYGALNTRTCDMGGMLSVEVRRNLMSPVPHLLKRSTDAIGAVALLLVLAPLMMILALAVKLDSPGPVLFRQKRFAGGTQAFDALKFRTMHVDAEARLIELLATDPGLRLEYETYHKLSRDPRITRVGRILRRISFDELPQLWNVLVGDMSLIGPRPYLPEELKAYPEARKVLAKVRPGITGLWQVSGRHRTTFEERIALDVAYIENYSIWFDFYIVFRTVVTVIKADGA